MGQSESVSNSCKNKKNYIFGSYKNKENPRPGYYITPCDIYYRGDKIDVHIPTFKKLRFGWAKDKNYIYYKGKIVDADIKTFKMDENGTKYGKDKSGKWFNGKKLPK